MTILDPFRAALKVYCKENMLDFNKVLSAPRCGNDKVLFIQRVNKSKKDCKITNNEPAEILISAAIDDDGNIQIQKGENADKYLS
jgi:hypothetical protein